MGEVLKEQWTAVDHYVSESLGISDPILESVLKENAAAGLPAIDVSPNQGKFLHLLARINGSGRILEIGTLGGYSTIWLARALPPTGRLVTLEADAKHAATARLNIARAGLSERVEVRVGLALETLPQMEREELEPFDLLFIDADKANIPEYLKWALKFSRRGSVIVVDNVIRGGAVIDENSSDPSVQGVRRLFQMMASEPRLSATALQTVGSKGYDGFVVALVVSD